MLFNIEKRIKYLGFNDFWFAVISIIILSIVTTYMFNTFSNNTSFIEIVISWAIALFFTLSNWFFMRNVIIYLRQKIPLLKDTIKRILIVFLFVITSVPLIDYIGNIIIGSFFENNHYNFFDRIQYLVPIVIISVMIQAIYEAVYYYAMLKKVIREEEQTKQVMVQAQLDALRNQAQPHFFFNTLNTLRDIIDQNSKEEAKDFVDKLSGVYRFILESGNVNVITLRDEIKFSKAYIHIQSERFGDNLQVEWNIPEMALYQMVVPMSIQLLLENAIKHNIVSRSKPLRVIITVQNGHIQVSNKIQAKSTKLPSTKLGLKNIEKRYALMSKHPINISNDGEQFIVTLPLLTSSDQNK